VHSDARTPAERVGPGLWSIPVPIPWNPLGATLAYLIESAAGPVLIDAGWDHPDSWQALVAGLRAAGTAVGDLYGVLVTHHHRDHLGLAAQVRAESGAWVALHPADTAVLRRLRDDQAAASAQRRLERSLASLAAAGAPPGEVAALGAQARAQARAQAGRAPWPVPFLPDRELADGELADVPGRRLRALWTPGHSPGHTCFYLERERLLLSGDHLLPGITPHIGLADGDDGDPLADFLASLDRLSALDVAGVLPAHEHRFTAHAGRAREIAAHHQARLAEVEVALTPAGATLWEVAAQMEWNQPWREMSPGSHRMALSEAAAHLRYLERRARVRVLRPAAPVRYELSVDPRPLTPRRPA
jgi:glyoxylase-like metal-dependent hydrolase (beta-lactamase superfamily II)